MARRRWYKRANARPRRISFSFFLFYSGFPRSSYSVDYFQYTELISELLSPSLWLPRTNSLIDLVYSSLALLLRYTLNACEILQLRYARWVSFRRTLLIHLQLDTSSVFRGIRTSLHFFHSNQYSIIALNQRREIDHLTPLRKPPFDTRRKHPSTPEGNTALGNTSILNYRKHRDIRTTNEFEHRRVQTALGYSAELAPLGVRQTEVYLGQAIGIIVEHIPERKARRSTGYKNHSTTDTSRHYDKQSTTLHRL